MEVSRNFETIVNSEEENLRTLDEKLQFFEKEIRDSKKYVEYSDEDKEKILRSLLRDYLKNPAVGELYSLGISFQSQLEHFRKGKKGLRRFLPWKSEGEQSDLDSVIPNMYIYKGRGYFFPDTVLVASLEVFGMINFLGEAHKYFTSVVETASLAYDPGMSPGFYVGAGLASVCAGVIANVASRTSLFRRSPMAAARNVDRYDASIQAVLDEERFIWQGGEYEKND